MAIKYAGTQLIGYGKAQVYDNSYIRKTADGMFDDNKKKAAADKLAKGQEAKARAAKLKAEKEFLAKADEVAIGKVRNVDVNGLFKLKDDFLANRQDNIQAILGGDPRAIANDRKLKAELEKNIIKSEGLLIQQVERHDLVLGDSQFSTEYNMNIANQISSTSIFDDAWASKYTEPGDNGESQFVGGVENLYTNIAPTVDVNAIVKSAVKDIDEDVINGIYTNKSGGKEIITKKSVADETLYAAAFTAITDQKYPEATMNALKKSARKHGEKYLDDEGEVDIKEYVLDVAKGHSNRGLSLSYYKDSKKSKSGNGDDEAATNTDIVIPTESLNTSVNYTGGEGSSLLPTSGNLSGSNPFFSSGIDKGEDSRASWNALMGLEDDNPYIDYSGKNPTVQYTPTSNAVMAFSKPTKNAKRTFQFQSPPNTRNVSSREIGGKKIPPGLLSKSEIFDVSPTDVRMMWTATEDIKVSMVDKMKTGAKTFNLNVKKGDWVPEWVFQSTNQDIIDALKSKPFTNTPWLMSIDEHKTSKPTIAAEFTPALFQKWSAWMIDNQENPYLYINAMKKEIFGIEGEDKIQ